MICFLMKWLIKWKEEVRKFYIVKLIWSNIHSGARNPTRKPQKLVLKKIIFNTLNVAEWIKSKSNDIYNLLTFQRPFTHLSKDCKNDQLLKPVFWYHKSIFSWNPRWECRRLHSWFAHIESLLHGVEFLLIEK